MAIDFPDSPSVGDQFVASGKTYQWDGTVWTIYGPQTNPDIFKVDTTNNRVGINNASPITDLDVDGDIKVYNANIGGTASASGDISADTFTATGTGANTIPTGTTAERPAGAVNGMIRFNTTTGIPEYYSATYDDWFSFTATSLSLAVSYLVVAGGASGGTSAGSGAGGGGGGAGGLLSGTVSLDTGTAYTVTVGAGGAARPATADVAGNAGSNSVGFGFTASGGGGGGGRSVNGVSGGSGGGSGTQSGATNPGSGVSGQGNAGGITTNYINASDTNAAGGGGGAASVGGNAEDNPGTNSSAGFGGDGGSGEDHSSTFGTTVGDSGYFAGGGGGGIAQPTFSSGGVGGGGNGGGSSTGSNATINTGGGGGGGGAAQGSGAGGSGVVLVRYKNTVPDPTVGAGLSYNSHSFGEYKVLEFTAGSDTVTW